MKKPAAAAAAALAREQLARLLPPSVVSDLNRNDRAGALHRAWGHVYTNQLRGAYYEFGVYRGDAFRASFRARGRFHGWLQGQTRSEESWRRSAAAGYADYEHAFLAFDTFEGIPDNDEGCATFAGGTYACSLDQFRKLNESAGIREGKQVHYFAGSFAQTRRRLVETKETLPPAAIVNVDCDLYSSAVDALAIVRSALQQGTVLLMDDWNVFSASRSAGERKAVSRFLAADKRIELEPWFAYEFVGQAFLVHIVA